jgi:DNA invertase Pin-like site-specific DNA recombinase
MSHHTKVQQIGYIRVSTVDQNTDRQLDGVRLDQTYMEKISGKSTKRPQLQECLKYMRSGDTLNVHSMDRLARNLKDLQEIVENLTSKGIMVKFHKENLTFNTDTGAMSKLMLQIMGAVAEFERSLIKERQMEGIQKAKKMGKHLGRRPTLNPEQVKELKVMVNKGIPKTEVAKSFGISRQTLYRLLS